MTRIEVRKRFGGMVNAFQYGAPPHGGCAAGIDRIVMLLAGTSNIREVIMFPMTQRAEDLMMNAPCYLRIKPEAGSIELGHIALAPALQRTRAATEAMYLMMEWAFGAGYRRFEWKCDALNMPSRRAAQRLGLSYEGTFRQATVVKGRNRDTAWFAAIDSEWPALKEAFGSGSILRISTQRGSNARAWARSRVLLRVASDPAQDDLTLCDRGSPSPSIVKRASPAPRSPRSRRGRGP